MNIRISINCTECKREMNVPIRSDDKGKSYLSDAIEEQYEGFYCNLDQQNSMKINCTCGNEIRLYY